MSDDTYFLGDTIRAIITFEFDDVAADVDTITAKVIDPEGTETPITPSNETGDGQYAAAYTTSTSEPEGRWRIRATGSKNGNVKSGEEVFPVNR